MEINIGSNIFKNTPAILIVQGKEQISLEIGKNDSQTLLTMEVYDSNKNHIAKLNRNAWVFNNKGRFEIRTNPKNLQLIDKENDKLLIEVNVMDENHIQIINAIFYTYKGDLLVITKDYWTINNRIRISGNYCENCSGGIKIG